jgi:hypothetical protein
MQAEELEPRVADLICFMLLFNIWQLGGTLSSLAISRVGMAL